MRIREISDAVLAAVMMCLGQVVPEKNDLMAYQSMVTFDDGVTLLVRAIVENRTRPMRAITIYRTSKVTKYWRDA